MHEQPRPIKAHACQRGRRSEGMGQPRDHRAKLQRRRRRRRRGHRRCRQPRDGDGWDLRRRSHSARLPLSNRYPGRSTTGPHTLTNPPLPARGPLDREGCIVAIYGGGFASAVPHCCDRFDDNGASGGMVQVLGGLRCGSCDTSRELLVEVRRLGGRSAPPFDLASAADLPEAS